MNTQKNKQKQFIIAANWKMNPSTAAEAKNLFSTYKKLAKKYPDYSFITAVPAVYLSQLASGTLPDNLTVASENVYIHDSGSYTGAISAPMVQDAGARATLVGHSERRNLFGVSDELISKKINKCIDYGLPVIACFGESIRDDEGVYIEELERQLQYITQPFQERTRKSSLLTVAYEPVWAIGSHAVRPITEEELFSTMLLIKNILTKQLGASQAKKIKILYGGSVNSDNARALSQAPGVGGFLIGRAGLSSDSINQLVKNI